MGKGQRYIMDTDQEYNAANGSQYTIEDCREVIGKRASLTLTGMIVDAGVSPGGPYVKFKIDDRWGFPPEFTMGIDLDPFEFADEEEQ